MNKKYFLVFLITVLTSTFSLITSSYSEEQIEDSLDSVTIETFDKKLMIKELEEINPEEEIAVIIEFKEEPISSFIQKEGNKSTSAHAKKIENIHTETIEKLKKDFKAKEIKRQYKYLMNGLATKIKTKDLEKIKKLPDVKNVWKDENLTISLQDSVPLINADDVWVEQNVSGSNITGEGIIVAIIDTGIAYNHSDFEPSCDVSAFTSGNCNKTVYGYDYYNDDDDPYDDNGHGTHCAGIVGANGTLKGVAPGVKFLAYKVCSSTGSCPTSDIVSAIESAVSNGADVISMSLGGSGYADSGATTPINNAVANGTVVVVAAGNEGPGNGTIEEPGATLSALTVGAVDKTDDIASFSSRGFSYWSNGTVAGIKPDVIAPGVSINSTVPTGTCEHCTSSGYKELSGTSMSTPHIAGVVALLKQAHPSWTVEQVKSAIANTAEDLDYDVNTQGSGRVDAFKSYNTTGVVIPNNFYMGANVENDTEIWNSVKCLNITNLANYTITYTLNVNISQTGINASLSNSSITLDGNESAVLNLTVEVDNSQVSDGIYDGTVIANSSDTILRIPFAFLKTKEIFIYHGENWLSTKLIKVVNESYDSYENARNGTNYADEGEYYILSRFSGCPPWVEESCYGHFYTYIFDYVNLTSSATLYLNKSMAKYKWNYTIYDKDGNELVELVYPDGEYGSRYQCRLSPHFEIVCADDWAVALTFNKSLSTTVSSGGTISTQFFNDGGKYWTFSHFHTVGVNEKPGLYIARNFVENITGNKTLVADTWANLTIKYNFPPFNVSNMTRRILIEKTHGDDYISSASISYRLINTSDMNNQTLETIFITPNENLTGSEELERVGEWFQIEVQEGTSDSQRSDCVGDCYLWYETPLIEVETTTHIIQRIFDWYIPEIDSNYTIHNHIYETGISPSYWNGRFVNLPNKIHLEENLGYLLFNYFLKQNNVYQGYGHTNPKNLTYTLINSTGSIIKDNETINLGYLNIEDIPSDKYSMSFYWSGLDWINEIKSSVYVNVTFNLSLSDRSPPYLMFFRIISGNKTANENVDKIIFKAYDMYDVQTQNLYYKPSTSSTWNELTISKEYDYNYSNLPTLPLGFYDLMYNSSDPSGNTLTQIQQPAFSIVSPKWSNNITYPTSPATYSPGKNYQFNVTWIDPEPVSLALIEQNFTTGTTDVENKTMIQGKAVANGNEYYYEISNIPAGTYIWRSFANNTYTYWNVTNNGKYWVYTINKDTVNIDIWLNGTQNNNKTLTYPSDVNATCKINITEQNAFTLLQNGTSKGTQIGQIIEYKEELPARVYNFTCHYSQTQNYSSFTRTNYLTLNRGSTSITLYKNGTLWTSDYATTYPEATEINATINVSSLTATLLRNGTNYGNPETILLGAGSYNYTGSYSGNENYTASQTERMLTINKTSPITYLYLDGSDSDRNYINDTITELKANSSVPSLTTTLYANYTGVLESINSSTGDVYNFTNTSNLASGYYLILANTTGNQNYSNSASVNHTMQIMRPLIINLISPSNSSTWSSSSMVTFSYNVSAAVSPTNCSLIVNNEIVDTNDSIIVGTQQTFSKELSNGNYNWSVNCTYALGTTNNSLSYSLTVSYTSPDNGGDGDGGDGDGNGNGVTIGGTPSPTEVEETIIISSILAGESKAITFKKSDDLKIQEIEISVKNDLFNVKITVKEGSKPSEATDPVSTDEGSVYKYLEIIKSNITDADIGKVKVKFKVDKSWVTENNINSETVALNRYADDKWNKLSTSKTHEDTDYYYFETESPTLSIFAITGEKLVVTTTTVTTTTFSTTTTTVSETEEYRFPAYLSLELIGITFLIAVIVILIYKKKITLQTVRIR